MQGNKFAYYTYILVPNMINGLAIYLEPPSRRGLVINLFCNLVSYNIGNANSNEGQSQQCGLNNPAGFLAMFFFHHKEETKAQRASSGYLYTQIDHHTVTRRCKSKVSNLEQAFVVSMTTIIKKLHSNFNLNSCNILI